VDKPLTIRRHWHYVDYGSFVRGTDASELQRPQFETWAPPAVLDEARKLYAESASQKDPTRARELLSKLVADSRMKSVWAELYKKKQINYKSTDEFLNPIHMTKASKAASLRQRASLLRRSKKQKDLASYLEFEATSLEEETYDPLAVAPWSEQNLGVQLFFWHVFHAALESKLEFLTDIKAAVQAFDNTAKDFRSLAEKLSSYFVSAKLREIALECESAAGGINVDPKTDNPWIITRDRGINDAHLRTFVASVSITTQTLLNKNMYGTIATLANVVFGRDDISGRRVRGMLRLPSDPE
jgi:hypothetical protein